MRKFAVILLICMWLAPIRPVIPQVQEDKPLNAKYVEDDLRGIKFLIGLCPIETHSIASLKKLFEARTEDTSWFDEAILGFGAKRVTLKMGLGYTTIYIDFLVFQDQIVHYKIGADVDARDSKTHTDGIVRVWKDNGGPPLIQKGGELSYEKNFPELWKAYYREVSKQLGPMKPVEISDKLKPAYALLTNPFENSRISVVACDDGKPAIDDLEDANRIDLIENVLRGYNPGGRIYAAISLLRMQLKGRKLSVATKTAVKRVVNLNAEAGTCRGDMGQSGLSANDLVPEFVRSTEWYLLRGR